MLAVCAGERTSLSASLKAAARYIYWVETHGYCLGRSATARLCVMVQCGFLRRNRCTKFQMSCPHNDFRLGNKHILHEAGMRPRAVCLTPFTGIISIMMNLEVSLLLV